MHAGLGLIDNFIQATVIAVGHDGIDPTEEKVDNYGAEPVKK